MAGIFRQRRGAEDLAVATGELRPMRVIGRRWLSPHYVGVLLVGMDIEHIAI